MGAGGSREARMAGAENGGEQHDDGGGDNFGGDPLGSCSGEQHDDNGGHWSWWCVCRFVLILIICICSKSIMLMVTLVVLL